jgi:formylglycine-generating enzyme required for sulfatase activity
LGFCYYNGTGATKDYEEAVKWFRKAAQQNNTFSQFMMGLCYYNGQGVPKDFSEGAKWSRKSADQGYADAQVNLGVHYYRGQGVPKDFSEAAKWYRKAADQGNANAQNTLGFLYRIGRGVAKDQAEAISWCRKALEGGCEAAVYGLGLVYLGQGNKPEAIKALRQALAFYEKQVQSSPDEAVNYAALSALNLLCGQVKEAEAQSRKGLNAKASNTFAVASLKACLGHAFLCQGFTAQAIEEYHEALKLGFEKDDFPDDFGLMKSALPEFKERIETAEKEIVLAETPRDTTASEPQAQPLRSGPPSEAPAAKRRTNSLGMVFVAVPGTEVLFSIWETRVKDYAAYAAATPGVRDFWRTLKKPGIEDLVDAFNAAASGKKSAPKPPVSNGPDHPVKMVTWAEAKAFCDWLTRKELAEGILRPVESYRLPRDLEWSAAVGLSGEIGTTPEEKSGKIIDIYPWGSQWPPPKGAGNYADLTAKGTFPQRDFIEGYDDGYATTAPVGSFQANRYGLYDLGGNVAELCEDGWWQDWGGGTKVEDHVTRGASWAFSKRDDLFSSTRDREGPDSCFDFVGFRVVLEVHPP